MSKIIKILISIFGILVVLTVIAALIAIILFPSEKIKTMIVDKTSSAIDMPVSVGAIGLSFAGIPTIKVTDITVGPAREGEPLLLNLETVKVRVNLFALLKKRVEIVSIQVGKPSVTLITRKDGSTNLPAMGDSLAEAGDTGSPPSIPIPLSLNILKVSEGHIEVDNRETASRVIIDNFDMVLSFDIGDDLKTFNSAGKAEIENITLFSAKTDEPLTGFFADFSYNLSGDLTTGNMKLTGGDLSVNDIPVDISASVESWTKTSFAVSAKNIDLENILKAVPDGMIPEKDKIIASGALSLTVDGTLDTEPEEPVLDYDGSVVLDNITISYEGLPKKVDEIKSTITFSEKDISIREFSLKIGSSLVTLSGTVTDYTGDPILSIISKGDIDLSDITGAFPLPEGMDASGMIDFNISMDGAPSDLNTFKANGGINIKNVSAVMPETLKKPAIINGTINVTPTAVTIKNINLKSGKSDFDIKGSITHYMTLAGLGKDNAVLTGTLHSDLIDVNDMLVIEEEKDPETIKPWDMEETIKTLPIPPQLSMDVVVDVGSVIFGRLKSDSASGHITLKDGILEASELTLKAYQGILTGSSAINMTDTTNVTYHGDFTLNAFESAGFIADLLGIGEIFRGKLSSSLSFSGAGLDSVSMLNNLKAAGDMNFKKGQIVNWDFTKKLGDHIKFLDFDTLDFSAIKNSFRIENSKFITPDMVIKSNAGDIRVDGVTGFDTSIDYSLSLLLNKKTSQKAMRGIPALSKLMSGGTDQIELIITARGTFMSPSFSLDTSKAEDQLKKQAKKEVEKVIDKILDKQGEDLKKKGEKVLKNLFK